MNHDHDDGLVHSHGWACRERGAPRGVMVQRPPAPAPIRREPDYDDGLVHDHGWARAER